MAYVTVNEVRSIINISSSQIDDSELANIITFSSYQLNEDLQVEIDRERIEYIDDIKTNNINGTNTTYYVKNGFIGDLDDNFDVDTDDIEVWKEYNETKTYLTISSIDVKEGSFVVSLAPANEGEYYIKYAYSKARMDTPSKKVVLAAAQLVAAWAYSKLNVGKAPRFRMGNLTVFRDTSAHKYWMSQYKETIAKINSEWMVQFADSVEGQEI